MSLRLCKEPSRGCRSQHPQPDMSQQERNSRQFRKLIEEGEYSRAIEALASAGIASNSPAILERFHEKHPQVTYPPSLRGDENDSYNPLKLSLSQVLKSLESFKHWSAPGPSGLRAKHLKLCISFEDNVRVDKHLQKLTVFLKFLIAGKSPLEGRPFFS